MTEPCNRVHVVPDGDVCAEHSANATPTGSRTCECGCRHPVFRCRRWPRNHEPHYWPALASDTTFYCDGGPE